MQRYETAVNVANDKQPIPLTSDKEELVGVQTKIKTSRTKRKQHK